MWKGVLRWNTHTSHCVLLRFWAPTSDDHLKNLQEYCCEYGIVTMRHCIVVIIQTTTRAHTVFQNTEQKWRTVNERISKIRRGENEKHERKDEKKVRETDRRTFRCTKICSDLLGTRSVERCATVARTLPTQRQTTARTKKKTSLILFTFSFPETSLTWHEDRLFLISYYRTSVSEVRGPNSRVITLVSNRFTLTN